MTSSPRIAYLLSRYPAVSHTFFLNEIRGLRALGLQIATASINPPDRPSDQLSADERTEAAQTFYLKRGAKLAALASLCGIALRHPAVLVRGLGAVYSVAGLTLKTRAFWLLYLAEALLLGDWMQRNDRRHLHVHFGGAVATVGMLTSQAWAIPFSLTIHGPEELQNIASYHLREKLAQARFVVCISDFCRSQLLQITPPAQWGKFCVIRLGVAPALLDRTVEHGHADGSPEHPVHVLCVGRLVPEKGQRLLLQAVAAVRRQGLNVHLTLAGDGVDRETLERETAELDLSENVRFAGATAHATALDLCASADVFVLPSFAEGIPVALMEAMALRVPCISTTVAGIPELIQSGETGLLVPPSNLHTLTAAIERLVRDPGLRHRLATAAHAQVGSHYNLADNVQQLAEHLVERCSEEQSNP